MRLVSVYEVLEAPQILYRLLAEREPHQNISHKRMPSPAEHMAFYLSKPYEAWYLMRDEFTLYVGACYLTRQQEVGVFVVKDLRGQGYGAQALAELQRLHPGRLLANINPQNEASLAFFAKHGFRKIQETYELA